MEKINVFDVQIPDGRQIRCISYNKVTYFDLEYQPPLICGGFLFIFVKNMKLCRVA